jgi:lipoate-protein ligase A
MRHRKAVMKEKGEKLLRLSLDVERDVIRSARLSGDFFIHPEEGAGAIEERLAGLPMDETKILAAVRAVVAERSLDLIGLSPETIARAVVNAK